MLLAHPVLTGAVALLAVNDQVLKPAYGTWWTGKLSDVAGVVLVTWVLAVVTGYAGRSALMVALAFVALKVVPGVAEAAAPILGGVTLRDPTDLVALVALGPVVVYLQRVSIRPPRALRATRPAVRASRSRVARVVVAGVTCGLAALAVGATSCAEQQEVSNVRVDGGSVWAQVGSTDGDLDHQVSSAVHNSTAGSASSTLAVRPRWARSIDGGRTWTSANGEPSTSSDAGRSACSDALGCFRLVGRDRVEHRDPTSSAWSTAFAFTREQKRRLKARDHGVCSGQSVQIDLRTLLIVPRPDGEHVVVAAGSEGALERTPSGEWHRRAVLGCRPTSLTGPSQLIYLQAAPFALAVLSLVPLVIGIMRRQPWRGAGGLAIALGGAFTTGILLAIFTFLQIDYLGSGPALAVICAVIFLISLWVARGPKSPRGPEFRDA
ncbi:hypothetical protein VV02_22215 [Luteipulveratus mongoliensis]|uniref:Uncharacterized protein n=2 Tax=Luteipulveratus mongoliensis TaxID=571913 RepID=A0A0K1JMJ4_9MICO|nr:hypothetical protein VV02_22215 [Luteipulveratus mongoliensis]